MEGGSLSLSHESVGVREGSDPWGSARILFADEPATSRFTGGLIVGGSFPQSRAGRFLYEGGVPAVR